MSRDTIEMPRVCPLCHSLFTMSDTINGHLCQFSFARPIRARRGFAWAAVGTWVAAVTAVIVLALLEGL